MTRLDPRRWKEIERILDRALELTEAARAAYLDESCRDSGSLRDEVEELLAANARAGGILRAPSGLFLARLLERMRAETESGGSTAAGTRRRLLSDLLESWTSESANGTFGPDVTACPTVCGTCGLELPVPGAPCPGCEETLADSGDAAPVAGPRRVAGYRILRELGAGGMGTVFEAHDEKMNRRVALKLMARHQSASARAAQRFAQEAWIAGRLSHPNIVKVHERGEWEDLHYFSMELVEGGSLHDVISRMKTAGRDDRLDLDFGSRRYVRWAVEQVIVAARALDHAHRQGVVHRDIKPLNLLLGHDPDEVKIADFGLAFEQDATRMTTDGKALGTLSYMSPEQLLGKQDEVDSRTDVYALGVTLYELLTLTLPYVAKNQQMYINALLSEEARRPSRLNDRIDRDLEVVACKALEKRPGDRYATAGELADDLENVLNLRPIVARPSGWVRRTEKWVRRKPMHATVAAILAVAVPVIGVLLEHDLRSRRVARGELVEKLVKEIRWLDSRKRYGEITDRAERVLKLQPENASALSYRALVRMHLALAAGEFPEAGALREGALEDSARLVRSAPDASWPHRVRARVLRAFGRAEEAEREEELARIHRPETLTGVELEYEAVLAMEAGDHALAVELYSKLILERPHDAIAVGSRGAAYDFLEDFDAAYREYRIAVGIDPELALPYVDLARIATHSERYDEARAYLETALELDPDSAIALVAKSLALSSHARHAAYVEGDRGTAAELLVEAEEAARRAIELEPERPWGQVNLGWALTDRVRLMEHPDRDLLVEAARAFDAALSHWSSPPSGEAFEAYASAFSNRCDVLIELGDLDGALESCERASALMPDHPTPHYNIAGIHALAGRPDEAIAALRKDLDLGDTDWQYLSKDRWFESMREDPGFRQIVKEMKAAAEARSRSDRSS